jgi:hypothetical protein
VAERIRVVLPQSHSAHSTARRPDIQTLGCRQGVEPHLPRRAEAVASDQPPLVVEPLELAQGLDRLCDRGERSDPKQVLLDCADESLGDAIALVLRASVGSTNGT